MNQNNEKSSLDEKYFKYGANQCGPPLLTPRLPVDALAFNYLPRTKCEEFVRCPCTNSMESLACPKGSECRLDKELGNVCYDAKTHSARLPYPYCQN
jgi:hypothetical protein